jgi:hypothetical protein
MGATAVHGYGAETKESMHKSGIGSGAYGPFWVSFTKLGKV